MRKNADNTKVIRAVERETLDVAHLKYEILRRPQDNAVAHILKVWASVVRDFESDSHGQSFESIRSVLNVLLEGAEHAIRWALQVSPPGREATGKNWKQKDDEALKLLLWAGQYAKLYNDHTAWSRGHASAAVDVARKTIRFTLHVKEPKFLVSQVQAELNEADKCLESFPKRVEQDLFWPWVSNFENNDFYELPPVPISLDSDVYQHAAMWVKKMCYPSISSAQALGGFTLAEFRHFYSWFWLQAECIRLLETTADQMFGLKNEFGSRLLQGRRDNLISWFAQDTLLRRETVEQILIALTFKPETRHPGLTGRPFIETSDRLTLLPRFFAMLRPEQVLTSSLLSGPSRYIYESIVEELEVDEKKRIQDKLLSTGHVVNVNPKLARDKKVPLTPDIVTAHPNEGIVVVIEYKHATTPRGAAAVSNRIHELTKWCRRCGEYYEAAALQLHQISVDLGLKVPAKGLRVLLVSQWATPIPIDTDADSITFLDRNELTTRLAKGEGIGCIVTNPSAIAPMTLDFLY